MPPRDVFFAMLALAGQIVAHSEEDFEHMGPLGFMWPEDREWVEETGMTGPCGNTEGVVNRTEFPLTNGALALEQKQEAFDVQVSITFDEEPSNSSDFEVIIPQSRIPNLEFSHVCLDLPNLPSLASDGQNATLQIRYTAEYIDPDHHHKRHAASNETFYVCADVTLVESEVFDFEIPCFNVTADYEDEEEHGHSHGDDDEGHEHDDDDESEDGGHGHSHDGLSGEVIAGIVIGSIVGAALIALVAWYLIRKDRRNKQVAQHVMENSEEK